MKVARYSGPRERIAVEHPSVEEWHFNEENAIRNFETDYLQSRICADHSNLQPARVGQRPGPDDAVPGSAPIMDHTGQK